MAVTYVPDSAPVRQKMLFASTRLTLVRELGSEHFRETIFATTAAELTPEGFEKHDKHAGLDAPLTEEEESLGRVKRAEMEAGQGSGRREIHLSKSLAMPVGEDALAALGELGKGERGLVMLVSYKPPLSSTPNCGSTRNYANNDGQKINTEAESVELVPSTDNPSTIPDLTKAISDTEPRFTFFRYTHTHAGTEQSPILFIYTNPSAGGGGSIRTRMLYPLMKRAVVEAASSTCGVEVEKKFEVEGPSEITEEGVLGELHPKAQVRQGFSRPKRPGR